MRNPIRIEEARAAHVRLYSLVPACAWIRRVSAAWWVAALVVACLAMTACSEQGDGDRKGPDGPGVSTAQAAPIVDRSAEGSAGTSASSGSDASHTSDGSGAAETPVIVFLGTSLTAGYGLEEAQAFPALIQRKLDRAGLDYRVINAGVSGDTSAGGRRRLAWLLRLPIAVLVLELGANDMLRGQRVDQLRQNLEAILDETRDAHPDVRFVIAGMRAAPNLGRDYGDAFDAFYPALADRYDAAFVPFLLQDVAARRQLNQADGIHPTAEGHALIADRVWKSLAPVLKPTQQ